MVWTCGARGERLRHFALGVALLDHVAGQQPNQLPLRVHHRKGAEREPLLLDQTQHIADELVRRRLDGLLDQAVDIVLHPAHLRELLPLSHVVMNQAQPAAERHGNRHARFGHRVHVRRDHGDVQVQPVRERRVQLGVARQDLGIKRRQGDVVVRQPNVVVGREECIRRLEELGIQAVWLFACWHVGTCQRCRPPGKRKLSSANWPLSGATSSFCGSGRPVAGLTRGTFFKGNRCWSPAM